MRAGHTQVTSASGTPTQRHCTRLDIKQQVGQVAPQRVREAADDVGKPRQRGAPALKLLLHATCAAHTAPLRVRMGSRTMDAQK